MLKGAKSSPAGNGPDVSQRGGSVTLTFRGDDPDVLAKAAGKALDAAAHACKG